MRSLARGLVLVAFVMVGGCASHGAQGGAVAATSASGDYIGGDYLISETPYSQDWINVFVASAKAPPASGQPGTFLQVQESKEVTTASYWKTRPAASADLKLGVMGFCFEGNQGAGVLQPAASRSDARAGNWIAGKISDVDPAGASVRIAQRECLPSNVRVEK